MIKLSDGTRFRIWLILLEYHNSDKNVLSCDEMDSLFFLLFHRHDKNSPNAIQTHDRRHEIV
jgi:hypothetical protein